MALPKPITRRDQYLNAIANENSAGIPDKPKTREEQYLNKIVENTESGGPGEGDMKKSVYDSNSDVANAGGIASYVADTLDNKLTIDNNGYINL